MYHLLIIITIAVLFASNFCIENGEDKLILKPVELIDLVIQEQLRKDMPAVRRRFKDNIRSSSTEVAITDAQADEDPLRDHNHDTSGDEERLRTRKVWSRWSKWSDCSATCGGGSIVRRRLCVAGRCAPGELEEQRRPCNQVPCASSSDVVATNDLHELE